MSLDLRDRVVYTEAATGAYAVTAAVAALAGASSVIAVAGQSRHGTVADATTQTEQLAAILGVRDRINVTARRDASDVATADVVTNSGHVRPIDGSFVRWMKPTAVVPLMFEAWEIEVGRFDVDLPALRERGIAFAGTSERHPTVGVFEHLGSMAVAELIACGVAPRGARVLVVCDNPFAAYLEDGLARAGVHVTLTASVQETIAARVQDVIMIAARPAGRPIIDPAAAAAVRQNWPGAIVVQFWGDIDRTALAAAGVGYWPAASPAAGHMGVLPSAIGPEPVVQLQTGGLKVAEVLLKSPDERSQTDLEYIDEL
jgi:hypothetical protein